MSRIVIALMCAVSLPSAARAQDVLSPEQHLEQARQLLAAIPPGQSTAGQALATLQRDFAEFAAAYFSRTAAPTSPSVAAPQAAAGAPPAGTVSAADASMSAASDWRARYLLVESDLTTLVGPPNASGPGAAMPGLDPASAAKVQEVRQHLELLYAGTINARDGNPVAHTGPDTTGAPVPPTGAAPLSFPRGPAVHAATAAPAGGPTGPQPASIATPIDTGVAAALLERMQTLVDDLIAGRRPQQNGPVGTSGSFGDAGKVSVDRPTLVELRSEITQLRLMLQR